MDKNFIRILIFRFFENDFPQKTFLKFQQWLTREEDSELKDDVLQELWERETTEANARTLLALKEMNKRIRKEKNPAICRYRAVCFVLPRF